MEVVREPRARSLLVARLRLIRVGVGMAGRRRGAPRLLAERRHLCRRSAPRRRRCTRRRSRRSRAGGRRGVVRRLGADQRHDGHDLVRRIQGVPHAPRGSTRPPGGARRRGRRRRRARPDRRGRAGGPLRPPRCPPRLRRHLRRSALAPSASGRLPPSTCARGAARTSARRRSRPDHIGEPGPAGNRPCFRADTARGSSECGDPARAGRHLRGGAVTEFRHPNRVFLAARRTSPSIAECDRRPASDQGDGGSTVCEQANGEPRRADAPTRGECEPANTTAPASSDRSSFARRVRAPSRRPSLRAPLGRGSKLRRRDDAPDRRERDSRGVPHRSDRRRRVGREKSTPYHWRP
jgi:hypothetical protein